MVRTTGWGRAALVAVAVVTGLATGASTAVAAPPTPGSDGAGDPYYPTDGNGGYHATDYQVAISYDPVSHQLTGDTAVSARATQHLSRFDLDLFGLTVDSVAVDGQPAQFARSGEHELVITPRHPIPDRHGFRVRVRYHGVPQAIQDPALGANGWQISSSGGAFAAGEPRSASTWYPVNDTPLDKASFHLSARVPDGWSVISNGREGGSTSSDGWTTYRWDEDTPIASYLTTVGIDHWTFQRGQLADGTPLVSAYAPGAENKQDIEARLPEILQFLSEKFGPYPQDAAGGIFIADRIPFSLETQTRPIFAQWTTLTVLVHENAHQWYGDSVSVHNWKDVCLNECFASYAQWLWSEAKEGLDLDAAYRQQVARYDGSTAFWNRPLYDMGPGHEFTAVYTKGKLALHALRHQIGEPAFDLVLRTWPALHRNGNASWPEFERYVEQVSGQDLTGFFQAWFRDAKQPDPKYLWPGTLHP